MTDNLPTRTSYPPDHADDDHDNGTMPQAVAELAQAVVGRRIVSAERQHINADDYQTVNYGGDGYISLTYGNDPIVLTLDNGRRVALVENGDCCAYTYIREFLLHPDSVDHAITGVATEDGYETWHILADLGDVMTLDVNWSAGNPFYYTYGFTIAVSTTIDGTVVDDQKAIEP